MTSRGASLTRRGWPRQTDASLLRIGAEELPPCRLCFQGAPAREVERCRVDPDPGAREEALLAALEAQGAPAGETLVAYALL